jgi:hypothetical protein
MTPSNKKMSLVLNSDLVSLESKTTDLPTKTLSTLGETTTLGSDSYLTTMLFSQTKPAIAFSNINRTSTQTHIVDIIESIINRASSSTPYSSLSDTRNHGNILDNTEIKTQLDFDIEIASSDGKIIGNIDSTASTNSENNLTDDFTKNNNFSKIFKITKFKNLIINTNTHLKDPIEQERKIKEIDETKAPTLVLTTEETTRLVEMIKTGKLLETDVTATTKSTEELGLNITSADFNKINYSAYDFNELKSTTTTNITNSLSLDNTTLTSLILSPSLTSSSTTSPSLSTTLSKGKSGTITDVNKNSKILFFTSILKTVAPLIHSSSLSYTSSLTSNSFSMFALPENGTDSKNSTRLNQSITNDMEQTTSKMKNKLWNLDQDIFEEGN